MEDSSGLQSVLKIPFVYNLFQEIVGGNAARKKFVKDHIRARPSDRVVDIGCGPADLFSWLPDVSYIGFDVSEAYIAAAQQRYGAKGIFIVGDTTTLWDDVRLKDTDIVICAATLHHLDDDQALHLMKFAHHVLKKGGRLITGDPCWIPNQGWLSRWITAHDRGKNVRTEPGYRQLAEQVFQSVTTVVDRSPLRIPGAGCAMECQK
jgi:SAM-dependent methyltransferase